MQLAIPNKPGPIRYRLGLLLAIVGALLSLMLPIGIIKFVINMIELFNSVEFGDPKIMAGQLSIILVDVALGLIMIVPGAAFIALSITICRFRRPWIYRVAIYAGILSLIIVPIGTVFGIVILWRLKIK